MTIQADKSDGKAIVIGASMAGLLAARVLANHFGQVTLLERDTFPAPGANRKGVPQGKHTHILLERGRQIMEHYLPGLTDDLIGLGAVTVNDVSANVRWFQGGAYHQPGVAGFSGLAVSRPTLEAAVRQRVLDLPNICVDEDVNVSGLVTTADHDQVTGVHLDDRQDGRTNETMLADLIVDASGRGSRTPAWLDELGYVSPKQETVHIGMGYVTCFFRRRPEQISGIEGIVLLTTPPDKRMGVLLAQDGDRWVVTVGGYLSDHAPTDLPGFLKAVKQLPVKDIYAVVKDAEPLGDPVPYTFPANLRHRYEALDTFPKGYLVIGDALCSFNPIYGQGMTVSALEAQALDECLAQHQAGLAENFFDRAGKIIDGAWDTAVGSDLSIPEVEGKRTPMVRFLNWYIGKLHKAAHTDAQVSIAFLKVINMVTPPPSMMHPRILARIARANLQPQRQKMTSLG